MNEIKLRDYQQAAFKASIDYLKSTKDYGVIEFPTGGGKSMLVAAIADWVSGFGNKFKVLCLAPSKELVEQNYEKFLMTGNPASIYSASAGRKDLRHTVIFGTPKTVLNGIEKFPKISIVIIDECHQTTPTIKKIIDGLNHRVDSFRVIGMTATPYRTGEGYIYRIDDKGQPVTAIKNPYYTKLIHKLSARYLIDNGFLTPPVSVESSTHYDTSKLEQDRFGNFDKKQVEQTFVGKGRLTYEIVKDIVEKATDRKGVLIFAANLNHAREVLESLPVGSRSIDGTTKKGEREKIIKDFKAQRFKYLVNVSVLTTGFDAPHVDLVAILRATESPGLLQQIIGRGLRLSDGKQDALILDYAENITRHFPAGDIFDPEIKVTGTGEGGELLEADCPICQTANQFKPRPNPDNFEISKQGYFLGIDRNPIKLDGKPLPAHFGRRCFGLKINHETLEHDRCEYRWSFKKCPECEHENDIAARRCEACGAELVDPNEKLKIDFERFKKDPYTSTTDKVLAWKVQHHTSIAGNDTVKITYTTEFRTFDAWYLVGRKILWDDLSQAVFGEGKICPSVEDFVRYHKKGVMPKTITASKSHSSGFFTVHGHNRPETIFK